MDESLDAWAVHGVGGFMGTIFAGIFATTAVCSYSGLLEGNVHQFSGKRDRGGGCHDLCICLPKT